MATRAAFQQLELKSRAEWRAWLAKHYTQKESVWVVIPKKGATFSLLTVAEVVEEALCFGWIDSVPGKIDDWRYKLLVSPRKPNSNWSKINKARVAQLTKAGLMQPPGLAMVALAKKTGTWDALNDIDELKYPPDLEKAFTKNKQAKIYFDAFPPSTKKGILEWILNAKTTETRTKRIADTVAKAEQNIRANQYVRKQ
jgi:uncharacterized protein YdeI (YjbR/CyaY-like superfamily)